ncbi:NAD(P)-binding protein [Thozetella sp. PMI_491]|nr:NAD(P)-binding protein [Thozetella sp. PMI_491]
MTADTLSLAGKVAIVTGSGRENGIGAGVAFALGRNGAAVTINYISDSISERAKAVAEKILAEGGRATVVQTTVDTPEGAKFLVQETLKAFGTDHIDILVNNAGYGLLGPTLDSPPEGIAKTFRVNTFGPIFMAQAAVPHMPRGGRIINVSSTAAKVGRDSLPIYGASKAALDSLMYSWAKEWGRSRGITVNSVAPGPVFTDIVPIDMADELMKPDRDATRAEDRPGTKEDIGDAVLLLASEKSRWITGQYISVSGGVTGN